MLCHLVKQIYLNLRNSSGILGNPIIIWVFPKTEMSGTELPESMEARVAWALSAPTNEELIRRYELWAEKYDADIGTIEHYLGPVETAKVAKQYLPLNARIMDAGAGTGLSGEGLHAQGFENLIGVDYSASMLEVAKEKGIYREVHQCNLAQPTPFADNSFDGLCTCGTSSQVPSASLREYARLVKPGGRIVFCVFLQAFQECGYADILDELEEQGVLEMLYKGEPFQLLPTSEPDVVSEVWVFGVLK